MSVSLRTEIGKILFAELPDKRHEFCDYLAGRISALIGKCATPTFSGKKEEKRFGDICLNCGYEKILHNCSECGMKQPEPKPKDRIEELDNQKFIDKIKDIKEPEDLMGLIGDMLGEYKDKINELTRHINKES